MKKLSAMIMVGIILGVGAVNENVPENVPLITKVEAKEAKAMTLTVGAKEQYKTINEALKAMKAQTAETYVIKIKAGTYREKLTIDVPNVLMIGEGNPKIVYDDAEGTPLRAGDTNGNKKTYTMECGTVKITEKAKNFQAIGITFANDFPTEEARVDKRVGGSVQAFAMTNEADESSFYNCRFLGRQDTLYANKGKQYYKDCYIEGDVDFIFGQATAVFEKCEIKSLMRAVANDGKAHSVGYVTAPSTLATDKGYLFYKCHLTSDIESPHYALLGRPWHPSSEQREVNSAATFRECKIDTPMKEKAWNSMKNKYATFQPEDNRLYEYKNTGKGAILGGNRRQLTDEEAKEYTVEKFLGEWKPKPRMKG